MTDDEILDRMARHATRKAHQFLPAQEVEDAVQTAILQVWRRLPKLDPDRDPWPLLTRIVRQELAMYARAFYQRGETASLHGLGATETAEQPACVSVDEPRFTEPLRSILDSLPERQRAALVECVAEGRTKQQAAAIIGCSDVSVGNYIRRALPVVRERMAA